MDWIPLITNFNLTRMGLAELSYQNPTPQIRAFGASHFSEGLSFNQQIAIEFFVPIKFRLYTIHEKVTKPKITTWNSKCGYRWWTLVGFYNQWKFLYCSLPIIDYWSIRIEWKESMGIFGWIWIFNRRITWTATIFPFPIRFVTRKTEIFKKKG